MNRKKKRGKEEGPEAQVDELLKAVEDEMLLNLSLNSHTSRLAPNYIDSDLDRRFRALKSRSSSASSHPPPNPPPPQGQEEEAGLGDDLAARFAALRATLPGPSPGPANASLNVRDHDGDGDEQEEEEEDEQVEKLIRWAKDAARLDPSPPSDDELHDSDDDDDDGSEDEEDDRSTTVK